MRRVVWLSGLIAVCAEGFGCGPSQTVVRVETMPPTAAQIQLLANGVASSTCTAPCGVEIREGVEQHIAIRAAGFYEATFSMTYLGAANTASSQAEGEPVLRVPLVPIGRTDASLK